MYNVLVTALQQKFIKFLKKCVLSFGMRRYCLNQILRVRCLGIALLGLVINVGSKLRFQKQPAEGKRQSGSFGPFAAAAKGAATAFLNLSFQPSVPQPSQGIHCWLTDKTH